MVQTASDQGRWAGGPRHWRGSREAIGRPRATLHREPGGFGDWEPWALEDQSFDGSQHEQTVRGQQLVERLLHAAAGVRGQVDQQVPAEDDVVRLEVGAK